MCAKIKLKEEKEAIVLEIVQLIGMVVAATLAIVMHELAHGYVSYKLGDPTAKQRGRLSLNPFRHLDPIGTFSLIVLKFGWAKPVPVNPYYYKNKKKGMVLVGLAGPVTNFILAFISIIGMQLILVWTGGYAGKWVVALFEFLQYSTIINLSLGTFNLIPFPPLDGSKIIGAVLPEKQYFGMMRYEKYGYILLMILMFTGVLSKPINWVMVHINDILWTITNCFIK